MNLKKLERYLQVNFLGPGSRLIKKNLPGRGLTSLRNTGLEDSALVYNILVVRDTCFSASVS